MRFTRMPLSGGHLRALFLVGVLALGLAPAASAEGVDNPSKLTAAYMDAVKAGDADAVADLYNKDALLMGPDGSTIEGRDAIRALNAQNFAAGQTVLEIGEHVGDFGDRKGIMVYQWTLTITPEGQAPVKVRGRSLLGMAKSGDAWLITADMFQVLR